MAENLTIARPYAEAVFASADAERKAAAWSQSAAAAGDDRLRSAICTTRSAIRRSGRSSCTGWLRRAPVDTLSAEAQSFVRVLIENDRLAVLPEIATLVRALKNEREGVVEAQIESAFPVDDARSRNWSAISKRRFKRKVRPQVTVDRALIGGALITVGDEVIDGTVRGRLAGMSSRADGG